MTKLVEPNHDDYNLTMWEKVMNIYFALPLKKFKFRMNWIKFFKL